MQTRRLLTFGLFLALSIGGVATGSGFFSVRAQEPGDPPATTITAPSPRPPITIPPPTPVKLDRMAVAVLIEDQVATTTIDLVFTNGTDRPQEATLLIPLPAGAAVSDLTMTLDGLTLEGQLLDRAEAAQIYQEIVRARRDPALLEYAGLDAVRARVFPVPARGESRLTVRFSHFLPIDNGTLRYRLPLGAGADVTPGLSQLTISARVTNGRGVGALFSPTHPMRIERTSETEMTARYEATALPSRGVFELDVLPAGEAVPAGMITYRAPGEDGFFMLWLAPPLREEEVVDKDVILVLDTSGSMSGVKIEQAKAALRFVLNRLNSGDRFTIVDFSSGVRTYAPDLQPASDAAGGLRYVDRLRAEGSTNINEALLTALRLVQPERPTTLLFLTDGLPTVGETNRTRILDNVRDQAPANARLFVFGVGNDVDTTLLDTLATQNRGDVVYVEPREDVEEKVANLYARVSSPQLTDLRLDLGSGVYDIYPQPLPDLFGGQTLYVFGRYRTPGTVDVRLSGATREGPQSFTFDGMQLTADDRSASYLPYLWASRKVTTLLRQIRLLGPDRSRELIDEVVTLATRYGIVTPYTSFLVLEPGAVSRDQAETAVAREVAAPATGAGATSAASQTGAVAQATAVPAPMPRPAATTAPGQPSRTPLEQRFVGDKSFVLRDGVWTDTAYQPGMTTTTVAFGSDAYFTLLAEKPALAPFFALGERVIVIFEGTAYEVTG